MTNGIRRWMVSFLVFFALIMGMLVILIVLGLSLHVGLLIVGHWNSWEYFPSTYGDVIPVLNSALRHEDVWGSKCIYPRLKLLYLGHPALGLSSYQLRYQDWYMSLGKSIWKTLCKILSNILKHKYTECFKTSFTNFKAYTNLFI
jgi:hypothetical protein